MSTAKKKPKNKPIIQRGIPANPSVTITSQVFKRSAGSRLVSTTSVSSTRSSTPLRTKTTHEPSGDADTQLYSDVDEELLEKSGRAKRKKPSQSVSVSTPNCSKPYLVLTSI